MNQMQRLLVNARLGRGRRPANVRSVVSGRFGLLVVAVFFWWGRN
jgi:hypothetical protein